MFIPSPLYRVQCLTHILLLASFEGYGIHNIGSFTCDSAFEWDVAFPPLGMIVIVSMCLVFDEIAIFAS